LSFRSGHPHISSSHYPVSPEEAGLFIKGKERQRCVFGVYIVIHL